MKSKLTALFLSLLMVISYLPSSMITSYALPDESAETTQEQTNPVLILDKEFDVDEVFVYKIIDGSEYEKDAFGLISYSDSLKEEISEEYLEVDKFYDKILELFKDTDELKDLDKESDSGTFEVEKEKINEQSLDLYEDIKDYLDESKQLKFNKKHELNNLEEGVYFVLADKYYPQLINVTDSDKEINIVLEENKNVKEEVKEEKTIEDSITPEAQLPENKEEIKEENKESKDSEEVDSNKEEKSTKSSKFLKSSPLRSSSSNTITAFTTSIESGVQSKTIGDNNVLVLDLSNKSNSETNLVNSPIMYKVNFTLKGDSNFPVGSVSFTIPDHLYKDRNGNYIDTIDMPILEAPATNSKNFNYTHDEENHVYVITNTAELDSAYSAVFNFGYILNGYPSNLIDGVNANNTLNEEGSSEQFQTTLTVNGESLTETTDKVYINTETPNWYTYGNNDTKFYKSWPNSWGDKPSGADDYYYLEIKYTPVLSSTYTQNVNVEYTISGLNNSGEIIKMHWGPVSEYTYNNYGSFSGNSDVQDVSTLTGTNLNIKEVSPNYRYNSDQSQSTYTLIRYPKSLLDDGELHNLTYSKDFKWSGVDDTTNIKTKSYNESFNYQKRDFTPPGETFSISKNCDGNSSRTGLERLFNNTNYKISYYSYWTAYAFPHTLKDGGDPTNIDDYGYKKYHSVHIDDYFYISNKNNEYIRLTENEYFIKSVDLQFSAYTYGESNGSYQYTSKTLNSPLNYTLYGKTSINGDWIEIGHSQFNEETNKNEFIYADGEVKTITSSNLNNLSSLPLKRNDIVGVKLDTETNEVGLQTYIDCYTEFKPSNVYNDLLGTEGKYLNFINIASGYIIKPNGEISSYDNSSSTSYMPSYLKNDINTLDDNAYGERIMHDYYTVKTYADYYNVDQGYSKHTYSNDVNNSQVNCNYTLYSYEEPYGDYYSGTTQLYKDGAVRSQTNGTFYNLLPLGFNIDESTINVRTYNNVSDTIYTYELKPNWKNSGRTMLVVNCQTTEDVYNKGFYVDYSGYYSWNAISDYGNTLNNTFAYKTGNNEYGGYTTTYPDNGGNLPSTVKDLFIDVDEDGETTGNHRFYYSTINDTLNVPTTASISLEKAVKSNNSSNYIAGDNNTEVVTAGENYSYQIHWGTDDHSTLSNMVVYDNLEAFKPDGITENWQGIFDNIDLSSPRINGINPVVYYSTQTIDISEDRDLSSSKWSTTMPEDKSQIKAIAIDLSKDNSNNAYTLDVNKTISIIINMKAPYNNAQYLEEHNVKAYNSVYLSNKLHTSTGTTSDNVDNYEYTELGIETEKVKVSGSKRWLDKDDSNRPDSVVVSLNRNGTKIKEQTVSADTNWSYSFNNLQKYDNSGNEYTYTVNEETNIDNYKKVIKPIDEKGLLIHFDDSTEGSTSYINLYYMNNGQYYKSNNLIYDNIKGKTVYVPAETVTIYSKTYGGNSYKVDNIDIIDRNNKLADIIPTYSSSSLSTNPSYIFRGLNYPHYEGDTLITSTDTYVRYIPENIDSYNIYNVLDKTSVKVKKEWDDYSNSANTRPSNINIKLLQNDNELDTYSITGPTWETEITGLDAYDDNLNPYTYTVEEIEVPNYTTSIKTDNSIKITFGEKFATESTSYDYVQLFYERNGQIYKYVGSGSTDDGRFGGAKTSSTSLSNKTIYLPGNKAYIYWHTDGSVFEYGFDVDSITTGISTIPENEVTSTLPNYTITEVQEELPHSERDSSNQYGANINNLWLIDKSDSIITDTDKVVISNKGLLRNISGTKSWNNDTAANRPESVTINLLRNGEKVDEQSITASNNWEYEFENLPVYDSNNEKYQYSISEEAVEGYSTLYSNGTDTVSVPTEGYYNIENTWNPRTITITKQWTNTKGGDDSEFRPENITVHLVKKPTVRLFLKNLLGNNNTAIDYRYETEDEYVTDNTKWVKNGNTWTYTFAIPANNYDWQVYEDELDYYNESNLQSNPATVTDNAVTITNDFEPVIRIQGEKIWPENDTQYRPTNITVNLLRNGQQIDSKVVSAETNWKYDFGYQNIYDTQGNRYTYTLSENSVENYISDIDTINTTVTNTSYAIKFGPFYTANASDFLKIYYYDENNNLKQLTGQGSNSNGKWYGSSSSSYSLLNKTVYIPSSRFYLYWETNNTTTDHGFDITSIEETEIPNNIIISSTTVTSLPIDESEAVLIDNNNLPRTAHEYSNNEKKLWKQPGKSTANVNITNILNVKNISGTKTWVDDNTLNRPESITVKLLQNGNVYQSKTVTAANNWGYEFTNLPIYDNNRNEFVYTISEDAVNSYSTTYSNGTETVETPTEGYNNIINTWNPRVITITKQWLNSKGGDDTEFRPENIKVHLVKKQNIVSKLFKNNSKSATTTDDQYTINNEYITDDTKWTKVGDIWTYQITMPDNTYNWEVYEEELDYYNESNLESNPADVVNNEVTITNDFEPVIRIQGNKIWPENDALYRPTSITVNLLRNGQTIDTKEVTANNNWHYDFGYQKLYDDDGDRYNYSLSENPLEDYISVVDEVNSFNGTAITFGPQFDTETTCDYLKIYYKDENNNTRLLTGQGASGTTGFCGSGANMANKTVYVPSDDIYFYWHTDSSVVKYGFDIVRIESAIIDTDSITSTSGTIPGYSVEEIIDESNYPKTAHNYGNGSNKLWHYKGNISSNEGDGFNITNILNKQNISGTKTWIGDNANTRPESITVNLYQDGRKISETTTDASKNWNYVFEDVPIYKDNGITEYKYYVEEEPVENYYTEYDKSHAGVKLTFGNNLSITNSSAFMTILYKNSNGSWTRLIGQGSTNIGQWNSSNINTLKNKTLEVPSLEFYITWHGNNVSQKWDVTKIEICDDISVPAETTETYSTAEAIQRAYSASTNVEIDSNTLPVAPYNNKYEVLYHFNGTDEYKSNNLVNTYNLFNVEGTVRWQGDSDNKGLRPDKVILDLYQNDVLLTTQELTVTSDDIQDFVFNDIPRLDENGNEYHYVVHQRDIENYRTSNIDDLNILNECTKRNVTGYKVWVNDKNRNSRPESIKVILYDENNDKIAEKTVTSADEFRENCWKYTFENVDVFDNNGNIKSYHVEEEIDTKEYYTGYIPNYWYRYSSEVQTLLSTSAEDIYKGNVHLPSNIVDEALDAFGKYLQDNNIEFPYTSWENLTEEQKEIFTNWTNNYLEDLADQYFDENHLYGYNYDLGNSYVPVTDGPIYEESKLAASVEPLRPKMDLTSIVNVYRVKHLDGVKHWEDEGSQYQRPDSVTLGLYRNGEKVDEQVITADNGWEYSFTDLPEVDKDGNPYEYDIKEEDLENYITEYNQGDVTEGVEVTFSLPIENSYYNPNPPIYKLQASNKGYIYSGYSKWEQNNIYNNFSSKYGLVAVFKDGNTWYKMTLEELKSSYDGGFEKLSTKAAVSPSMPIPVAPSGITFIIPSKEFYIIPVFRYTDDLGGAVELMSTKTKAMAAISSDNGVPGLVSYKPVKLSKDDKAKLNYIRSVSKVEFPVDPYIDVFDYHMYNRNESGILFEKLGSLFNINDEVEHVIELKEAQLTDFLDEYITDIDTGHDWEVEKWIHNVAYHYKEQLGLTNYPLDAKTSYSGTKIWDENDTPDDDTPDSPPENLIPKAMAKASNNLTVKEAIRPTQPTSVTVVLLQDGKQYATQTIGEDTDWKFEFNNLPMFDQTDHHKYIYSIKEKSVKGYKSEVTDGGKNGHQVVISSDIYMNLYRNMHILAHYNGNWYDCDSLPYADAYSMINNKIKIYIPGDDFKIIVNGRTITQNEISEEVEYAIEDGNTPENYLTIDNIKAVNIPYEINNGSEGIYYTTLSGYEYFWYQVPQGILEEELSEGNNINITDGSIHSISIDQILEGYDSTNSDDQYSDIFNIYNYTSTNIEGIQIKNTYYEGSFKVKKVDEKGQILLGCEFSLYYADGLTWTKLENDPTAVSISDENGIVTFNNIPYGDYLMYETHPADGYKTPSKPWKVSINTNGSATIWDENGKLVPIEGTDKDYDLSNGVKITFNSETDIPYDYMYILAKNEQTNSAVVYSLRSSFFNSTYSNKSIEIPTKDFYIIFMNEGGGSTKVSSNNILSKESSTPTPYGFKVEKVEPIRTSWLNIYDSGTYRIMYDSEGITWDEFMNNSSEMIDIIECNNYPESKHYEEFAEYLMKDKSTAWHYDATLNSSSSEDYDNDALFEGTIITFGNNNHASVDSESNTENYYNYPVLLFEYDKQYYIVRLPNNPTELNNLSIKVPSNNIWLQMSGQYRSSSSEVLRSSTVPQTGVDYGYDLGNEIIDVKSIAKTIMTKSDVENALNSSFYQVPKSMESKFTPEFELTAGPQEIHWISDVLGDKDAEESVRYNAFYHYQNDASGLIPKYEIHNELTRTETILVNTEDEPIPGGVLQIIDKEGHIVDSWETTDVNHITWGLTEGEEYTIHQVSTPYPYIVAEDDTFTVLIGETTYVKVINDKAKNVVISKTVSGNGSNPDDIFNYHLVISGGHPNVTHTVQMSNGNNTTVTTDANGNATLDFTLKHNETATVVSVFKDTNISVTESGNNYIASYKIDNNSRVINESANVDLSASATMVNDDISIAYENTITLIVPTSAYLRLKDMLPYILMGFCLLGMIIIYRKNRTKKLNLTK